MDVARNPVEARIMGAATEQWSVYQTQWLNGNRVSVVVEMLAALADNGGPRSTPAVTFAMFVRSLSGDDLTTFYRLLMAETSE